MLPSEGEGREERFFYYGLPLVLCWVGGREDLTSYHPPGKTEKGGKRDGKKMLLLPTPNHLFQGEGNHLLPRKVSPPLPRLE